MRKISPGALAGIVVSLAVFGGFGSWFVFGDLFASHQITFWKQSWFVMWRLFATIACVIVLLVAAMRRTRIAWIVVAAMAITIVVGSYSGISALVTHDYDVRKHMDAKVKVTEEKAPGFEPRTATDVADASRRNGLGALTGIGDLADAMYLSDKGVYSTLVAKKAYLGGYLAVEEQKISLTGGNGTVTLCKFNQDTAARKLGGVFSHSLDRSIAHLARGTTFDAGDAYGYCDGTTPMVVVPLMKMVGWEVSTRVPAGVAVYNGTTGDLVVHRDVTAGQIPGPVYPMSLAAQQRESAEALGSFSDYWHKRSGWDPDPNTGVNHSEFSLRTTDGRNVYVTPLVSRNGSAVSALSVIDSDEVHYGVLNTLTVHKFADDEIRMSSDKAVSIIQGTYNKLGQWASKNNTMEVAEITPISQTQWVATLAQGQVVDYRVILDANGDSCLYSASDVKIHCVDHEGETTYGDDDYASETGGYVPQTGSGEGTTPSSTPGSVTTLVVPRNLAKLNKLTNDQLVELSAAVAQELADRARPGATTR